MATSTSDLASNVPSSAPSPAPLRVGVLALQGDFAAHARMLGACGAQTLEVRGAEALRQVDGLLIPGGESTTMSRLCDRYGLWEPLQKAVESDLPLFGTCAGMILLARRISGSTKNFEQRTLAALDIDVARNAYGRQLDSFETSLDMPALEEAGLGPEPLRALFIRAPRLERVGAGVQVLGTHRGEPVAVRQGARFAAAFHPEIAGDDRLHRLWLQAIAERRASAEAPAKAPERAEGSPGEGSPQESP